MIKSLSLALSWLVSLAPVEVDIHVSDDALSVFELMPQLIRKKVDAQFASSTDAFAETQSFHIEVEIDRSSRRESMFRGNVFVPGSPTLEPEVVECECNIPEFTDAIATVVLTLALRANDLAQKPVETNEHPESLTLSPTTPSPPDHSSHITKEERWSRSEKQLVIIGSTIATLGVGALIGGGVTLSTHNHTSEEVELNQSNQQWRTVQSDDFTQRNVGLGLLVGGGIALATGTAVAIVGVVRSRKRQAKWSLVPAMGGFTMRGRF